MVFKLWRPSQAVFVILNLLFTVPVLSADPGQILMVGFSEASVTPDLLAHLRQIRPGAIILFKRNIQNPKQFQKLILTLNRELYPHLPSPPLIAIDQEGGSVFRIPTVPKIPSPAAIGRSNDATIVEQYGFQIGKILRGNGISMNLAPVLDLDLGSKSKDNVIGNRSFGANPSLVAQMGYLFSKGLAAAGVIPTGKHFPGIGSIATDPHQQTTVSSLDWGVDWNRELLPFREFSRLTPSALMLSHVIYPKLDAQRLPASVSPYIIKRVLRDTFKYEGLVVTDDLLMRGITDKMNPGQAALASLYSGADLIMLTWSRREQLSVLNEVQSALKSNLLKQEDFDEKLNRIRKIKDMIGISKNVINPNISWVSPELRDLNRKLLRKNIARDSAKYRPLKNKKNIYLVNLAKTWQPVIQKRFPESTVLPLDGITTYEKLSSEEKDRGTLFYGISRKKAAADLKNLGACDKLNTVLIVTNDLLIDHPENYHSVFMPLWPFEGIANEVVKYL